MAVHVQTRGLTRHSTEVETAIYFTCAEALQNAIKHAPGASGVWIVLRQGRELELEVRDDGPGFAPPRPDDAAAPQDGLRNMRDRLEAVGGRLTVDSSPGHGTRITGFVPTG
jgi:signal transduction histidine kinase